MKRRILWRHRRYARNPVIQLEIPDEQVFSDVLSSIANDALEGDRREQRFLMKLWDEDWNSIKEKLETEGSVWYVWWMDGVRELMRIQDKDSRKVRTNPRLHPRYERDKGGTKSRQFSARELERLSRGEKIGSLSIKNPEKIPQEYVWISFSGMYEEYDTPFDAGERVGQSLSFCPEEHKILSLHYREAGVDIEPYFTGYSYISLFWGDEEGEWIRDLNNIEKKEFEKGIREGMNE